MKRTALLALVFAFGCAGPFRRAVAPVGEYEAYRRFRVSPSVEKKLAASYAYLKTYPSGAYRSDVAEWFSSAAPNYVDSAWNDAPHLRAFLASVPRGPDAARAGRRFMELEMTREFDQRRERAFDDRAAGYEERLAQADAGRRALVADVLGWTRRLASIRTWGGRTSELDSDFIYAYRLKEPSARCTNDVCSKTVTVSYAVPEGKTQSPRQAIYDVGLRLDRGGVVGAFITGPELFTRLGEAARVSAIDPSDWVGRAEAIGQASQMLALALESILPSSRCTAEAVSPVVLRRACDGVDVRVVSALDLSEEDRIVVEPSAVTAPPPGPSPPTSPPTPSSPLPSK